MFQFGMINSTFEHAYVLQPTDSTYRVVLKMFNIDRSNVQSRTRAPIEEKILEESNS